MKRIAIYTTLLFSLCAFAQSPSTVLSTLHTKGTTVTGGESKYGNYIPKLGTDGRLDYSVMPTSAIMAQVTERIDTYGSEKNARDIENVASNINSRIDSMYGSFLYLADEMYSNAVSMAGSRVPENEVDPVFTATAGSAAVDFFTNAYSMAVGKGSKAGTLAWQIGEGTNNFANTLQFRNTVLVDANGIIPQRSVPWAVSQAALDGVTNLFLNVDGGEISDVKFPAWYVFYSATNNVGVPVCLDGVFCTSYHSDTNATFVGSVMYNFIEQTSGEIYEKSDQAVLKFYRDPGDTTYMLEGDYYVIEKYGHCRVRITFNPVTLETRYTLTEGTVDQGGETINNSVYTMLPVTNGVDSVATTLITLGMKAERLETEVRKLRESRKNFDLESPSGYIYRIKVSDEGLITSTRIK